MDLTKFRADDYEPAEPLLEPLMMLSPSKEIQKIISFDQALSETGYVVIQSLADHGPPRFEATGMLTATHDVKGHENTLLRASSLYLEAKGLIAYHKPAMDNLPLVVVHETPPTSAGHGKMARPESSLLAALAIRVAAMECNCRVVMRARQKAYKRFTGSGNAEKKFMKEALTKLLDARGIKRPEGPWNQHIIDALGIALLEVEGGQ